MTLAEFLGQAVRTPFAPGAHDCRLFPANWVLAATGRDPAAAFRGRYASEAEGLALAEAVGGVEAATAAGMAAAGLTPTDAPAAGDVGVITVFTLDGPVAVGGIFTGRHWAFLSPGGVSLWPAEPIAAWRL